MFTLALLQITLFVAKFVSPVCISLVLVSFVWSFWEDFQKGLIHVKRLHQIPCHRCSFFTGEYNLKCTIHPYKALNEAAINCPDYEPAVIPMTRNK
jgi:hypothetical protein